MERIYEHIENTLKLITDRFNNDISYQNYDESKSNSVAIILLDSRNDEVNLSGETEWEALKFELRVVCDKNQKNIFENQNMLRNFVEKFEECESTVDDLVIVFAKHLGAKAKPTRINGYGLPESKCIIDFNYIYL